MSNEKKKIKMKDIAERKNKQVSSSCKGTYTPHEDKPDDGQ